MTQAVDGSGGGHCTDLAAAALLTADYNSRGCPNVFYINKLGGSPGCSHR